MIIQPHPNCDKCLLHETCLTPWMQSSGAKNPRILVIGEAPGEMEDDKGIPFVGRSGKLLRQTLTGAGFDPDEVRYTNVVKCRPPENKITKKAINACKHYVEEEIAHYQPDLVLLMGNSPLNAILGESGITTWNGVIVERDEAVYVPLFHPAYVLRNREATDEWLEGFLRAYDHLEYGSDEEDKKYVYPQTIAELKDMERVLAQSEWISYDVETSSLDPFVDHHLLVAVSFSNETHAYAVAVEHKDSPWDTDDIEAVVHIIRKILLAHDGKLIGHNMKFDQQHTRMFMEQYGIEDFQYALGGDTMLISHMLDSRRGIHSLKRLAGLHLGMYDYDKPLNEYIISNPDANPHKGGSYANIPLEILLPYAAMDADATLKLYHLLYAQLSKKQQDFHDQLLTKASDTLARVEYNGNAIDGHIAERYRNIYGIIQQETFEDILSQEVIKQYVKDVQEEKDLALIFDMLGLEGDVPTPGDRNEIWDELRNFKVYDEDDDTFESLIIYEITDVKIIVEGRSRKRQLFEFNPNSFVQLKDVYFQDLYYGMPVMEMTDTGQPSTKASVMKQIEDQYPIISMVRMYKLLTKMLGTYIEPAATGEWMSGDGRVRSSYNLHGTRTGRLSSSSPNMQNIPTPEKEPGTVLAYLPVKNMFTHTFDGGQLLAVDYSGMELRVFASLADCQPMLEIHRSGKDFHSMVSIMAQYGKQIADVTDDEIAALPKSVRYRYKWTNWTLLYGGDVFTLMNLYGMAKSEAEETVKTYYDTFPEVLDFRKWTEKFALKHGYIESPFGRREQLPYISGGDPGKVSKARRAAVNMPVQSAASDTLICALVLIDKELRRRDFQTMIVNTVHDSIVLDAHPDEIDDVAALCVDIMENITKHAAKHLPAIDFSWLRCPLKADVDVGTHYGIYTSYEKWKANAPITWKKGMII